MSELDPSEERVGSARTHVFAVALEAFLRTELDGVEYAGESVREVVEAWHGAGAAAKDGVLLVTEEATKTAMGSRLRRFVAQVGKGDSVIFIYAGRGEQIGGRTHLLAHDSQPEDLEFTSLPLAGVLRQLESRAERVILFLDLADGLSLGEADQGDDSIGFVSCSPGERSRASGRMKRRLWLHALHQALNGTTELRADGLQDYLEKELARLLRTTWDGDERQTPQAFGRMANVVLAAGSREVEADLGPMLQESRLLGERFGRVRSLGGFQKQRGHREPDHHSEAAAKFIRRIGADEIGKHANDICARLKEAFALRRSELEQTSGDGAVSIKTPHFDVDVWVEQDASEAESYRLVTEVRTFRDPNSIMSAAFDRVFDEICDTLVIELSRPFPVAQKVDELESDPNFAGALEYDGEASFVLRLPRPPLCLEVSADRISIRLAGVGGLVQLLRHSWEALQTLERPPALPPNADGKE